MIGLAILAAFAGPSHAQQKPDSALSDDEKVTKSVADAVDRQYKATLDRTRKEAKETRVDPWSNMRGSDTSKPKR
jgi:hypothetical protein